MMRLPLLFVTRAVQLRNPIPLHLTSVHGCILRKCHALPQNTQDIVSSKHNEATDINQFYCY